MCEGLVPSPCFHIIMVYFGLLHFQLAWLKEVGYRTAKLGYRSLIDWSGQGAHTIGRWTSLLGVQPACMAKEGLDFWICTREQGQRLPFTARPTLFNNDSSICSRFFRDFLGCFGRFHRGIWCFFGKYWGGFTFFHHFSCSRLQDYFKNVLEFERRQKMPRPTKRYKDRPENGGLPALCLGQHLRHPNMFASWP